MYNTPLPKYEEAHMSNLLFPLRIHTLHYPADTQTLFYLHWHREFELFFLKKGTVCFQIEDRTLTLRQGECIFINPNRLHAAYNPERISCEFTALVFSDSMLAEDTKGSFYRKYISPVLQQRVLFPELISPDANWQQELLQIIKKMDSISPTQYEVNEILFKSYLLFIWHLMYHHAKANATMDGLDIGQKKLQPALDYIRENYMHDTKLSDLAACISMSEGQFCRFFKKQMHYSPIVFLMRYRILESCRLLINTDKKIAEIANLTGFNNISYYNKTFLTIIGCTPTTYRRNREKI